MNIELKSCEEAISLLENIIRDDSWDVEFEKISLGDWVNPSVSVKRGNAYVYYPFMEAFSDTQENLFRLVALIKYDVADIRKLSTEDKENYFIPVQVKDGSSEYLEKIKDVIEKLGAEAIGKMSSRDIAIAVIGLALVIGTIYGVDAYFAHQEKKLDTELSHEVTLAEIAAEAEEDASQQKIIMKLLDREIQLGAEVESAISLAEHRNASMVKAATNFDETNINGRSLTRDDAKELRRVTRRPSDYRIEERQLRVIDIDTSESGRMIVTVLDPATGDQKRVNLRDRLLEEEQRDPLFDSLKNRKNIWIRVRVKTIGDEEAEFEIIRVVDPPEAELATAY